MRSPWPGTGHVNRNYGDLGERGCGRSGPPLSGQRHYNSYMEAEDGYGGSRITAPLTNQVGRGNGCALGGALRHPRPWTSRHFLLVL